MSQLRRNKPTLPLGHTVEGNKLVALDGFNFERHKHIIGISGSGKSSFIASIVVFLLRLGIAFCLIDPHGDLAKLVLTLLAGSDFYSNPKAYDRLWYVDFNRQDAAIAFNVLKQDHIDNYKVASNLVEAIHRAFPTSSGATTALDNTIEYSAFVLAENGIPLTQLQRFLLDASFRGTLLAKIKDQQIVQFFDFTFSDKVNSTLIASTMRRLDLLTFSPSLRAALGQRQNKLNFRYPMDNNISCIINLGGLSDAEKRLAGCLITVGLEQAFLSRATQPLEKRAPYHVFIDEFPLFSVSDNSFTVILEQVRKYGGTLYLAHQTTSQLSKYMTGSLQNAISILFKLGYEDSTWAAQRFVRKQEEQGSSLIDWVLHGGQSQESSPFDETKNTQEARQIFENLERAQAIVNINKQALHIRTLTIPRVNVDPRKLAEIEDTYATKLLTPLSHIARDQSKSNLVLVSSATAIKRRTYQPSQTISKPLTLFTGDLEQDIHAALSHFSYITLQQLASLLGKEKSVNYLRKKLSSMENKITVTQLGRISGGKPLQVYSAPYSGERKNLFLEHTLDCTQALLAGFQVPQIESSLTLVNLKDERSLKAVAATSPVIPDGLLTYQTQAGEIIMLVLEIDRSTSNDTRIEQKFLGYPAWIKQMGLEALTIAFVVTSGDSKRVTSLMEIAIDTLGESDLASLYLFAYVPGEKLSLRLFLDPVFRGLDNSPHALIEKPF